MTPHKVNNQTQLAKKDGSWIDRPGKELIDGYLCGPKKPVVRAESERVTAKILQRTSKSFQPLRIGSVKTKTIRLNKASPFLHGFLSLTTVSLSPTDRLTLKKFLPRPVFSKERLFNGLRDTTGDPPMRFPPVLNMRACSERWSEWRWKRQMTLPSVSLCQTMCDWGPHCCQWTSNTHTILCVNNHTVLSEKALKDFREVLLEGGLEAATVVVRVFKDTAKDWLRDVAWVGEQLLG